MKYTLKQLRYLVAVAERGNLSAAADDLYLSQPALSSAIAQLEQVFDAQLLVRHKARGVSLTPAGRALVTEARRLLHHAEELASRAASYGRDLEGEMTVGCFVTISPFHLPRLLAQFKSRYPGLEVQILEGAMDRLVDSLVAGEVEVALLYDLGLGTRLELEVLTEIPPYVLVSCEHPLARRQSVSLASLADQPMVLLDLPHSRDYFRGLFAALGIEPRIRHRTLSFELVRGMVANGHGYSILNLRPANDVTYDGSRLCCIPIAGTLEPLRIVLAHAQGVRLTRKALAFAECCRDFFAPAAR